MAMSSATSATRRVTSHFSVRESVRVRVHPVHGRNDILGHPTRERKQPLEGSKKCRASPSSSPHVITSRPVTAAISAGRSSVVGLQPFGHSRSSARSRNPLGLQQLSQFSLVGYALDG